MKVARICVALTAALFVSLISAGGAGQLNPSHAQTASDRDALVTLYNVTGGEYWINTRNWLSNKPIHQWYGVTTDRDGRVIALNLSGNRLSGRMPPEIGSLSSLQGLDLSNNRLSGNIPPELGNLSGLQYLLLSSNRLSGNIPSELGSLSSLQHLWLHNNRLSGNIPSELGNLSGLLFLALGSNRLSENIPPELGDLSSLQALILFNNRLGGNIPPELGSLSSLQYLTVGGNQLSGNIPPELGDLSSLQYLGLRGNQLSGGIPPELGNLRRLQTLDLSNNQLIGNIPSELGSLTNLGTLYLSGNQLIPCLSEPLRVLRRVGVTDVDSLTDCMKGAPEIVLTTNEDPLIYNGNVFVLPVTENFVAGPHPLSDYAARFYEYFRDDFDFLIFALNVHSFNNGPGDHYGYRSRYQPVKNDVRGIGVGIFDTHGEWGSTGELQGAIELINIDLIFSATLLQELMHRWANFIYSFEDMSSDTGAHWGFSSANGLRGGFDIADLVDHGGGRYSAGDFSETGNFFDQPKPYSPIELYLAGLIPPADVPDLWVAEDGKWLDQYVGVAERVFAASKVRTYAIQDIIRQHGKRAPGHSQSQKDFRAAVILLIDEDHPLHYWQLDLVSKYTTLFSDAGADKLEEYNFYEATYGRATITMDGLPRSLRDTGPANVPGAAEGLTVTGNAPPGIEISWSEPANAGGLAVTAYDLRHIESSADHTSDSNWTVVEDVWKIGDGALEYTLSGLTAGTHYYLQIRAVNGRGAGPWSAATPTQPID